MPNKIAQHFSRNKKIIGLGITAVLFLGGVFALIYLVGVAILKQPIVSAFLYYALIFGSFMFIMTLFALIYQFLLRYGIKRLGIFSLMWGHLTNEQMQKLDVKQSVFYEYMIMRLDLIFPTIILFGFEIYVIVPPLVVSTTYAVLLLGIVVSTFVVSYMVMTVIMGILFAIKNQPRFASVQADKMNDEMEKVMGMVM